VLIASWQLLTSDPALAQVLAGVVVSSAVAAIGAAAWSQSRFRIRPESRWLAEAARLPLRVLGDSALVTMALVRALRGKRVPGRFRVAHLALAREQERSTARRTLAILAGSFAPNTYVVGVDDDRRLVLFHQLVARDELPPGADRSEGR
jgi:multisubunit Na+/H+ antiporter MnhE subunit